MAKRAIKRSSPKQKISNKQKIIPKVVKRPKNIDWLGITAIIFTLLFGVIAILIPQITKERRELVYAVNPIRTTIVSASDCPLDLRVLYRGIDLGCDNITGAQVAIWNDGNLSIKQQDILRDVVIFTKPEVKILNASLRGYHNEETKFAINYDDELWQHGRIPVSWKILQKNDGDSIQLTYLGAPTVDIYVEGKIEGSYAVKRIDLGQDPNQGKSWATLYKSQKQSAEFLLYMIIFTIVITFLTGIAVWRGFLNFRGWRRKVSIIGTLCWLWLYVGLYFFLTPRFVHWPPFGF